MSTVINQELEQPSKQKWVLPDTDLFAQVEMHVTAGDDLPPKIEREFQKYFIAFQSTPAQPHPTH